MAENKRLSEFKDKYQIALTAYGPKRDKFNRWQSQYDGSMMPLKGKPSDPELRRRHNAEDAVYPVEAVSGK